MANTTYIVVIMILLIVVIVLGVMLGICKKKDDCPAPKDCPVPKCPENKMTKQVAILRDVNMPGFDLNDSTGKPLYGEKSEQDCIESCKANKDCKSTIYDTNHRFCWPKSVAGPRDQNGILYEKGTNLYLMADQ